MNENTQKNFEKKGNGMGKGDLLHLITKCTGKFLKAVIIWY